MPLPCLYAVFLFLCHHMRPYGRITRLRGSPSRCSQPCGSHMLPMLFSICCTVEKVIFHSIILSTDPRHIGNDLIRAL